MVFPHVQRFYLTWRHFDFLLDFSCSIHMFRGIFHGSKFCAVGIFRYQFGWGVRGVSLSLYELGPVSVLYYCTAELGPVVYQPGIILECVIYINDSTCTYFSQNTIPLIFVSFSLLFSDTLYVNVYNGVSCVVHIFAGDVKYSACSQRDTFMIPPGF